MQKSLITLMFVILATLQATAFAEQALVPQSGSGQVLCYDAVGAEIPCAGTGQDGDQQMGVPWPNPRFTDNGNGTVTDNLTGLIWLKNANCFGTKSWAAALPSANSLASGACGLTDGSIAGAWRLPNRKELESLINRQQSNPAAWLNTVGFSSVSTGINTWESYWSSSTTPTDNAWLIYLGNGVVSDVYKGNGACVWPVRGGQ